MVLICGLKLPSKLSLTQTIDANLLKKGLVSVINYTSLPVSVNDSLPPKPFNRYNALTVRAEPFTVWSTQWPFG